MPTILVGDGHATPDYISSQLAWDTLSGTDQGGDVIAECLGYCGVFTPTGAALNPFKFRTLNKTHDGTNESALATMERCALSQTSLITLEDIRVFTTNQYVSAFSLSSDNLISDRCVFDNQTAGVNAIVINGYYPNTNINNFIARGGADAINAGYQRGTNFNKGLVYSATGLGVNGSAGAGYLVLTDVFAFNNGTDYDTANLTLNTCASQDLTGTSGLTGYTSAELVNFSGSDYRIKSTSTLATAGSVDFIGAFLEANASILMAINGLTNIQTANQISLTQHNILSVNNIPNAQTIDPINLTQHNILPVNNASQVQTLDQVMLTQAHILSVNRLNVLQTIDQTLLAQLNILSVDSFFQSQALGIVTLTEISKNLLSIVNISQNQALTGTQLIQNSLLPVNELTQTQIIDAINFGGIVIGYLKGELSIIYAYNGKINITNALTGETEIL